jgi:hypothetical protein
MNIPINKNICVRNLKLVLNKTSKSVVPIIEYIAKIDRSKNNDPHKVYKKI